MGVPSKQRALVAMGEVLTDHGLNFAKDVICHVSVMAAIVRTVMILGFYLSFPMRVVLRHPRHETNKAHSERRCSLFCPRGRRADFQVKPHYACMNLWPVVVLLWLKFESSECSGKVGLHTAAPQHRPEALPVILVYFNPLQKARVDGIYRYGKILLGC